MASHHEPFSFLGPIEWKDVPQDNLPDFLDGIFSEAQTIIDSIPSSAVPHAPDHDSSVAGDIAQTGTTGSVPVSTTLKSRKRTSASAVQAPKLQKEWKEIKVNARENPHDVHVYKLGAKDGRGAWFARTSVHEDLSFDQWKDGMQREFMETMKVQGQPGSGSIRGIGADKRVENHDVADAGHVQVFQLSAQFPGPTSPRDFITLLLTTENLQPDHDASSQPLRQFMVVSKPCHHDECPQRQGIIRGQYESVEFIREVPTAGGHSDSRKSWSSTTDLPQHKGADRRGSVSSEKGQRHGMPTKIEWLMVTRSDPGGSVPRFMIEKGTPPGIVNDAGKFLNWLKSKPGTESGAKEHAGTETGTGEKAQSSPSLDNMVKPQPTYVPSSDDHTTAQQEGAGGDAYWSNGLFGMITGAFEAATSVVTTGLRKQFTGGVSEHDDSPSSPQSNRNSEEDETLSETSSIRSFASALERSLSGDQDRDSLRESQSDDKSQGNTPHQKELKKLQERRRRLDEKAAKIAERLESRRQGDKERDATALAKAREKHEKEIAKNEAKYKRELKKIEDKREQEERKAEERRKKVLEREEKSNLAFELDKVRAERDIAVKQAELLKAQVGELQAQNTMLVARLGKANAEKGDSASTSSSKEGIQGNR